MAVPRPPSVSRIDLPSLPRRLLDLPSPPRCLWAAGPLPHAYGIAIVGPREADVAALAFTRSLARAVAVRGAVVLSSGGRGIGAAAHASALEAGGITCAVTSAAPDGGCPPEDRELREQILKGGGTVVWPYPPGTPTARSHPHFRNGILVALADALVLVQAGVASRELDAAAWARRLGRPVFAVAAPPWLDRFAGSTAELGRGARPIVSLRGLLAELNLGSGDDGYGQGGTRGQRKGAVAPGLRGAQGAGPAGEEGGADGEMDDGAPGLSGTLFAHGAVVPSSHLQPSDMTQKTPDERRVLDAFAQAHEEVAGRGERPGQSPEITLAEKVAMHRDELHVRTGLPPAGLATALLTLSLERVLVEGPDGFFRQIRR